MATKKKNQEIQPIRLEDIKTIKEHYEQDGKNYIEYSKKDLEIQRAAEEKLNNSITGKIYKTLTEDNTKSTKNDQRNSWFNPNAKGNALQKTAGTAGDIALHLVKGFVSAGDKLADLTMYGESYVHDLFGDHEKANEIRKNAQIDISDIGFKNAINKVNSYSWTGDKLDSVFQSIGESYASAGISKGLGKVGEIPISIGKFNMSMPVSSILTGMSSGMTEAYKKGGTNTQAIVRGITSGLAEGFSEGFFGVFGVGGSSIESNLAYRFTNRIENNLLRKFARVGLTAMGEGAEEGISYTLNFIADNLQDAVNEAVNDKEFEKMGYEWDWGEFFDNVVSGAISGGLSGGAETVFKGKAGSDFENIQHQTEKKLGRALTESEMNSLQNQYAKQSQNGEVNSDLIANSIEGENKVVDALVQERITQEEKNGKELTNKEIAKIEEEVRNQIERGEVDTDKIDSILGGEDFSKYQQYSKEIQEKEARIKELDKIIEKGSKVAPTTEYKNAISEKNALQEQLSNYDIETLKDNLRGSISDVISSGSVLGRSYYEANQRSNTYDADISQYSENQRKTIQRAIDSGVLNNTTKTHEFVDMVAKLSEDKGVDFDFTNNENLKKSGFAVKGKQVNGYVNENGITLNVESDTALEKVVGHEITHVLEGTELYNQLQTELKNLVGEKVWNERINSLKETYKSVKDANVENEVTSDLVGEYLFTDSEFVKKLSMTKPNLFQKIFNEIKYMYKIATAGSKEKRQLEKVKKIFEEAYKVKGTEENNTKYGLSDIFKNDGYSKLKKEYQKELKSLDSESPQLYNRGDLNRFGEYYGKYRKTSKGISRSRNIEDGSNGDIQTSSETTLRGNDRLSGEKSNERSIGSYTVNRVEKKAQFNAEELQRIKEEYSSYKEPTYIAKISPNEFLKLTTTGDTLLTIENSMLKNDTFLLDENKLKSSDPMQLVVDPETNKVTTHEGRHRMLALKNEGIEQVDIIITTVSNSTNGIELNKNGTSKLFGQFNSRGISVTDVQQINGTSDSSFFNEEKQIAPVKTSKTTTQENKSNSLVEADSNTLDNTKYSISDIDNNGNKLTKDIAPIKTSKATPQQRVEEQYRNLLKQKFDLDRDYQNKKYTDAEYLKRSEISRNDIQKKKEQLAPDVRKRIYDEVVSEIETKHKEKTTKIEKAKVDKPKKIEVENKNEVIFNDKLKTVADNNDIRYSLSEDSNGNKLTKEQQEYFNDSKVRDEKKNSSKKTPQQRIEEQYRNLLNQKFDLDNDYMNKKYTDIEYKNRSEMSRNDIQKKKEQLTPEARKRIYDEVIAERENKHVENVAKASAEKKAKEESSKGFTVENKNTVEYVKYSLSEDNKGNKLTKDQIEYFKDSKVRDENGNLLVMYHGTEEETPFYVFKPNKWANETNGDNKIKGYFATDEDYSNIYGETKPYYLNIKNPLYMGLENGYEALTLKEWEKFFESKGITGVKFDSSLYGPNTKGIFEGNKYLGFEIVDADEYWRGDGNVTERIEAAGYDGLTWTEGGQAFMPFNENAIKNVDNLNPTSKPDIRYSLSDNKGRELSEQQQEYFKDSKVRDENGNLEVVYHRTGIGQFNEFKNDKNINFFTNDDNAIGYGDKRYDVYLNIKNPLIIEGNGRNWNHLDFNKEGVNQYKLTTIKEIVDNINKASFEDIVALATAIDKNNNVSDYIDYFKTPSNLLDAVVETYADENTLEGFVSEFGNLNAFIENDNIPSRNVTTTRDITEYAKENGYDGVIFKDIYDMTSKKANVYATLDSPNQIKNVDNTNPTDNNDIRYQMSNKKQIAPLGQYNSEDIKVQEAIAPLQEKIEELQNTIDTLIAPIKTNKVLNPNEISKLTPEDANTTPNLPNVRRNKKGDGDSKFFNNIQNKTNMLNENQKLDILNEDEVKYYDKITNKDTLEKAFDRLNENGSNETLSWFGKDSRNADAVDVAEGWILMKQYADNGDTDSMVAVAKKMRDIGTKAGQTVQAFNIMERMTPEGMVKYAQSELSEAYDQMVKNKTREWINQHQKDFDLTPEEVAFIMDTMEEVSQMEDGYEKKVKLAEIQKLMTDKLPAEKGAGIKAWMRISMLFNPKTQVRNVMGNAVIAPVNFFSDIISSAVDKQIAKTTGVRTTGTTKLSSYTEGFRKGLYQSYNDFKKGINTRDMEGNRFEIGEGKSFNDKNVIGHKLNQVDHLLGFMLDAGDRGFYEASFTNSINNQLVLNNTTEVTQEMIDIATQEALSRTWQDNNGYTKFVLDVRKGLNRININGYGLGDVLIPFAKTPANLTKAIVDYSPLGLVNTIVEGNNLKKSLNNGQFKAEMQHKFVQDLGKATAGTMLYVIGFALANAGITTGEADDDKDTKDFMKNTLGISSYSINIGGKSFTYDWAQPIAAPLAITSNIVQKKNDNASFLENVVSSLDTAGNILLEQSFMESINTVFNNNDGIATGIEEAILELPSRAIPTFMKQIVDLTDSTSRTTFVYDQPLETAINKIKAKIPGLSKTLAPVVDTMGREVQRYGGKNNIFNVFLNPANVNTENISQSASEIYKVYQSTGDKSVMPRVAPYYINKKGEKIILTTEQKTQYQKISGQLIEETVGELLYSDSYNSKSDVEKAEVIKNIVNFANAIAQSSVLGTELSDTYKKALEYSQIGNISDYYDFKGSIDNTNSTTKKNSVSNYLLNSDLGNEELAFLYSNSGYSSDKTLNTLVDANISIKEFIKLDNYDITSDYNVNTGKTISGSAKAKYINYVNSLNLSIPQKAMLIKMKYSFTGYDNQIVNYVNNLNKSYYEKTTILKRVGFDDFDKYIVSQVNSSNMTAKEKETYLKELGFNVKNGRVYY